MANYTLEMHLANLKRDIDQAKNTRLKLNAFIIGSKCCIECDKLNGFAIVIHSGKQLKLSEAESTNNMYMTLLHIHKQTEKHPNVKIIIETPAGKGTEKLRLIEDMCKFMNKFYKHADEKVRN